MVSPRFATSARRSPVPLRKGLNVWVGRFAAACSRAVSDAVEFEERTRDLEQQWRDQLGRIRAGSATELLVHALPGAPVLTVDGAAQLIGRTYKPANEAIQRLIDAGVLRQITIGRRNRAFEAPDVITAFTDLERQLASPEGDTRADRPTDSSSTPAGHGRADYLPYVDQHAVGREALSPKPRHKGEDFESATPTGRRGRRES